MIYIVYYLTYVLNNMKACSYAKINLGMTISKIPLSYHNPIKPLFYHIIVGLLPHQHLVIAPSILYDLECPWYLIQPRPSLASSRRLWPPLTSCTPSDHTWHHWQPWPPLTSCTTLTCTSPTTRNILYDPDHPYILYETAPCIFFYNLTAPRIL